MTGQAEGGDNPTDPDMADIIHYAGSKVHIQPCSYKLFIPSTGKPYQWKEISKIVPQIVKIKIGFTAQRQADTVESQDLTQPSYPIRTLVFP